MSDVTERYVSLAPAVRKALRDALAAALRPQLSLGAMSVDNHLRLIPVHRMEIAIGVGGCDASDRCSANAQFRTGGWVCPPARNFPISRPY